MLDENLPTFFIKSSPDSAAHHSTLYLTQHGSEPQPEYSLRRPDPCSPASRNNYAIAFFDSYNPEVIFAEILLAAEWTQPTLSAEEIRKNGGVAPPPQPRVPSEFTIQLYNPDQQVVVRQKPGSWGASAYWEFEIPQQTFRLPSASSLDKSQNDPAVAETTPKINFKWKREGKFSKDLICSLSGKSTNPDGSKRKNREPDIAVALFKSLREITIYEPNLYRVEVEDAKGFEVVLLLGATAIRDIYFGQIKDTFNIQQRSRSDSGLSLGKSQKAGSPISLLATSGGASFFPPPLRQHDQQILNQPLRPLPSNQPIAGSRKQMQQRQDYPRPSPPAREPLPLPADPRTQWEIDAETTRLQKAVEAESRSSRKERERAEQAEAKRVKKMVEAEQKEFKRREAIVQKETERLRKLYGSEQQQAVVQQPSRPQPMPQHYSAPLVQPHFMSPQPPQGPAFWSNKPSPQPMQLPQQSTTPFLQVPPAQLDIGKKMKARRSIFGLRSNNENSSAKLSKKKSSMF